MKPFNFLLQIKIFMMKALKYKTRIYEIGLTNATKTKSHNNS